MTDVRYINPRRHVVASQQFDTDFLSDLFDRTDQIKRGGYPLAMKERIVAMLFYQPSTRTRFSFEVAVLKLGGKYISTENAREFSSVAKGETLEDTIRVIGGNVDLIVMRHHEEGSALRAAQVSIVPLVSAGDGIGQHPTQSLLDVYIIKEKLGRLDGLHVVMVGDLKRGRTVRSLAYLLSIVKDFNISKIYI